MVHTLLLNQRKEQNKPSTIFADQELKINDYVSHEKHGVGQYLGLKQLNLSSSYFDFVQVSYKNKDMLYIPVEQLNLLKKHRNFDGYRRKAC